MLPGSVIANSLKLLTSLEGECAELNGIRALSALLLQSGELKSNLAKHATKIWYNTKSTR